MATRKLVGQVTPEERDEIQALFERRNGLNELAKILTSDKGREAQSIPTYQSDTYCSMV